MLITAGANLPPKSEGYSERDTAEMEVAVLNLLRVMRSASFGVAYYDRSGVGVKVTCEILPRLEVAK